MPAILASMLIVFALSIDDFVVTQYMSSNASTTTIPMFLYANARGGTTTPALNALATVLVLDDAGRRSGSRICSTRCSGRRSVHRRTCRRCASSLDWRRRDGGRTGSARSD